MARATFDRVFGDHGAWHRQANQLLAAAEVLANEFFPPRRTAKDERSLDHVTGCLKGSLLLLAAAVENALKAAVVAHGKELVRNGKVVRGSLGGGRSGHDLVSISKDIKLETTKEEEALLEQLTAVAIWAGKYQFPLDQSEYERSQNDNPRQTTLPTDFELAKSIVGKATALAARINQSRV